MGGLVDGAAGLLSRRLIITTWIPLFVSLVLLTVLTAAGVGWSAIVSAWRAVPADLRVIAGLAVLAATTMLAHMMNAFRPQLLRIYEGYWAEPLMRRYGRRHALVHARLKEDAADPWPVTYPRSASRVLPTRLGNILRAAEEHPFRQYGIPAVLAWPRLYNSLPETFLVAFGAAAADLELMITISFLGMVLASVGAVLSAFLLPWYVAALVLLGGAGVFWLGYIAAVRAAVPYANQVRAGFDVHRWKLLEAMGLRLPTSYAEERAQWGQLRKLWAGAGPDAAQHDELRYPKDESFVSEPPPEPGPVRPPEPRPVSEPVAEQPPESSSLAPSAAPRPATRTRVPHPARDLAIVVVAAAATISALTGARARLDDDPVHASRRLPAFRQLTDADLDRPARKLRGRYTLTEIAPGKELAARSLGPPLRPGTLDKMIITTIGIDAGGEAVAAAGSIVTLRWASKDSPSRIRSVDGVIVLRLLPRDRAVVAAMPAVAATLPATGIVHVARP
ncbi:hypothetical protein [Actinomadura rayongensis]|uniref:Uncharacterized protein n=1 Tax=Actinomadura rayongensis TaxID=1429076 RepID=A0A6I4W5Z0_9ACTN|nr:hypothetical protein [Actinomadura rayongensis]MXQ64891.1 hypothetical protein [Actinomadura rayongensis]